jgi:hypothetical protein
MLETMKGAKFGVGAHREPERDGPRGGADFRLPSEAD